ANVLHNATQHAPAGSEIEIAVQLVGSFARTSQEPRILANAPTTDASALEIRVRDHGPGLPTDMEERVFEKFARASGAPAGGTGLGLAISRGLMRAMKGDITVRNHPEGGAEFILRVERVFQLVPSGSESSQTFETS
ncbi:MAG: sensor histidine kinase, partial [Prosthecobacter sp.]